MTKQRIKELRAELEAERINSGELAEIEGAFSEIPDSELPEPRENAMAGDMLDELERFSPAQLRQFAALRVKHEQSFAIHAKQSFRLGSSRESLHGLLDMAIDEAIEEREMGER